jgi:hypothetical protein
MDPRATRWIVRATVIAPILLLLLAAPASAVITRLPIGKFGSFESPQGIAVDPLNGDVYVIDAGADTVSRYDSDLNPKPFTALGSKTIDGAGKGECPAQSTDCDETPEGGFSLADSNQDQVAIDRSGNPLTEGDIYITDSGSNTLNVFSAAGKYLGRIAAHGGDPFTQLCGVGVEPGGALDIGDASAGAIYRYEPSANPPLEADLAAELEAEQPCGLAVGVQATAGALFAAAHFGPVWKLDAGGATRYQVGPSPARGPAIDAATGNLLIASGSKAYEYDASGEDEASLLGTFGAERFADAGGIGVDPNSGRAYVSYPSDGSVQVFGPPVTPPPSVVLSPHIPLSQTAVKLSGYVTPQGLETTYRFEYGSEDCAVAVCTVLPSGGAAVGSGVDPVTVTQEATGLQAGATYHYRLVAENPGGSTTSEGNIFSTLEPQPALDCPNQPRREEQGADFLPDCRAYEQVSALSAATRQGADVMTDTQRVRGATDGAALQFSTTAAAAETEGLTVTSDYLAVRNPVTGWAVHGAMPPQRSMTPIELINGEQPGYVGELSADLSKGVFLSNTLLSGEGANVSGLSNFYRRGDLLNPGAGSYELLSDATSPLEPDLQSSPMLAGASADFSRILFESPMDLTADAAGLPSGPRLYFWDSGVLRLAGVLPAAEGGGPVAAQAGRGASQERYTPHTISADGSRFTFTADIPFSQAAEGSLYIRDVGPNPNPSDDTTTKVNESERADGDPDGPQSATFWDATLDLSQIFFTSKEALTEDAPIESPAQEKLYRYSADAPQGKRLTLLSVDRNPAGGTAAQADGVIGTSADGSYVYFVSSVQLVAGAPAIATPRIFVWHEGTVREVAVIESGAEVEDILGSESWQSEASWARVTPDGTHLAFITEGNEDSDPFDHGNGCKEQASPRCLEIYVYDYESSAGPGSLQCASCPRDGSIPTADASFNALSSMQLRRGSSHMNRPLSADGRYIGFSTAQPLAPGDLNDSENAYRFDIVTGSVALVSSGRPGESARFVEASADGRDVFIATRSSLLPGDRDENVDIYDARVDGGFAAPPPPAAPCESEQDCRPAAATADAAPPASANLLSPPARLRSQPRHHAGRHRRCVRQHRGRHRSGGRCAHGRLPNR